MKQILLIGLILIATFLQSCDERITPNQVDSTPKAPTNTELITSTPWQFSEVVIRGGGKTQVQFSRPNSIGLSSDFSTVTVTYKTDGTYESDSKKGIAKGTWKFSVDEKQILVSKDSGKSDIYDVTDLTKNNFNFSQTTTKASVGDESLWALTLAALGLPTTSTDISSGFSMIPK